MSKKVCFVIIRWNNIKKLAMIVFFFLAIFIIIFSIKKDISVFNNNYTYDWKIVIDPGHGGIDGGTSDNSGLLEKNINLDIGLKLRKVFANDDIKVIMTRDKDVSLENKSKINASRYRRDLDARKSIINSNAPDAFVSIHVNSSNQTKAARGILIYYFPTSDESKRLAQLICESINVNVYQKYLKNTSVKARILPEDYYILRETLYPGVLIETGFITNSYDKKLLKDNRYKEVLAKAVKEGILNYCKKNTY